MNIAITPPDGTKIYVSSEASNAVMVIDGLSNTVTATIPVDIGPVGLAITPDGSRVYVANFQTATPPYTPGSTVSVIDTAQTP
jgi:YVTN family beta-propeller protein